MRPPRLAAVVVACTALLVGCGGSPEASPPPSSSPSESASQSASPTPPTLPISVRTKNEKGAVAATQAFLDALKYSGSTGDVSALSRTFNDECSRCQAIVDGISKTYGSGGYIRGGDWRARDFTFHGIVDDVGYVDVIVDSTPQSVLNREDGEVTEFAGQERVLHAFQLRWQGQRGWTVGALDPTA